MKGFTRIDLAGLPFPDVVETLDYEAILADMKAAVMRGYPGLIDIESEAIVALLEMAAYRETLLRARVNDGAKAMTLAYATGADLDNLGAFYGAGRLVLDPGDAEADPPVAPTYEGDNAFRSRIQLALEAQSTAGPRGAYLYHTFTADSRVVDAHVDSTTPGQVDVTVLAAGGQVAPTDLVEIVSSALNDEEIRPLCDTVVVASATIRTYAISAELTFYDGPDSSLVLAAAQAAVAAYVEDHYRLGHDITRSGLFHALHQPGVQNVRLNNPPTDVVIGSTEAAHCTSISITAGGVDV